MEPALPIEKEAWIDHRGVRKILRRTKFPHLSSPYAVLYNNYIFLVTDSWDNMLAFIYLFILFINSIPKIHTQEFV
jgi:hypothetical protein